MRASQDGPIGPSPSFGTSADLSHVSLPTLAEIMSTSGNTCTYVPASCRRLWSGAVLRCISQIIAFNVAPDSEATAEQSERSLNAWKEFLVLPACILQAPARGGNKARKQFENLVLHRLERWAAGERISLWNPSAKRAGKTEGSSTNAIRRCTDLVEDGLYGQACKALTSKGICNFTQNNYQILKGKHPHRPPIAHRSRRDLTCAPTLSTGEALNALLSFPKSSSSGQTGLKSQHLLDAVRHPDQVATLEAFTDLVNLLADGSGPPRAQSSLGGGYPYRLK